MLIWKRNYGEPQHLFWFTYLKSDNQQWVSQADHIKDAIKGEVAVITNSINALNQDMKKQQRKHQMDFKYIQNKFNEARKRQDGIKEDLQKQI